MYAVIARISVVQLSEAVIDIKFNPIGVSPRNNPISPAMPKLSATLNTIFSIMSILSLFLNNMLTKQLPGTKNIKTITSAERIYPSIDSAGIRQTARIVNPVVNVIISSHRRGFISTNKYLLK